MPPRQSPKSSKKAVAARTKTTSPEPAGEGVREQLQRLLNPLELVVLTRERVQSALDEAVERGRLSRHDAADLAAELLARGRRQTDELIGDLEAVVSRSREGARRRVSAPADRVVREVDRARRAAGIGPSFPIFGYDDLTAAQVQARLDDLTPPELRKVRDYERRNANRKTVLGAIEQKLG